jgi:RND family efflux transporter MFP subunit
MKIVIAAVAFTTLACSKAADAPDKKGTKLQYPVDVATLVVRPMQYTVNAPGTLEAFQVVQITARVAGAVDKVSFAEGALVKLNQVLVTIDSERFQIAVEQAQSGLSKAMATQKAAQLALDRREVAQKASPGLVPGEEIEQKRTAVDTAKADVDAAKQALRVAQLNLRDSSVRTPIEGVVQSRTVQMGQFLAAGAVLATILQRNPLLLRFQVSDADAQRLKADMPVNFSKGNYTHKAKITLVGGTADPATRLVPITAQVDPAEEENEKWLRPGAFVQVAVPIGDAKQGIVVPGLAIQPTEKGNVVFVLQDNGTVQGKVVDLGMHTVDGLVEIKGVPVGKQIVVRGIEPLTDGAPVKVKSTMSLEEASKPTDAGVSSPPVSPASAGSDEPAAGSAEAAGSAVPAAGSGHHRKAP